MTLKGKWRSKHSFTSKLLLFLIYNMVDNSNNKKANKLCIIRSRTRVSSLYAQNFPTIS